MREKKYAAIEKYLSDRILNSGIEQRNDFDLSAQRFKIRVERDTFLLKVPETFVDDHDIAEIIQKFEQWNISALLKDKSDSAVLVGEAGPILLKRG